jgi:transposase-like protein
MSLSLFDIEVRRPRGRPLASTDWVERRRRRRAAYCRVFLGQPIDKVARKFRVSIRTIRRWVAEVMTWDDAESLMIRAKAERDRDS